MASARISLSFNKKNPDSQFKYEFLSLLGNKKSKFLFLLLSSFLEEYGITDTSTIDLANISDFRNIASRSLNDIHSSSVSIKEEIVPTTSVETPVAKPIEKVEEKEEIKKEEVTNIEKEVNESSEPIQLKEEKKEEKEEEKQLSPLKEVNKEIENFQSLPKQEVIEETPDISDKSIEEFDDIDPNLIDDLDAIFK